jgi:hypothetical protein
MTRESQETRDRVMGGNQRMTIDRTTDDKQHGNMARKPKNERPEKPLKRLILDWEFGHPVETG